jgi:hypothetical protein
VTPPDSVDLEDLREFFQRQGFQADVETVGPFPRVLIAEDPYTVLLIVETDNTDNLEVVASDAQSELTKLVADREDPSKRWDLYVVLHVRTTSLTAVDVATVERVSSDTTYARKLVRINMSSEELALTRALRPFLPIHHAGEVDYGDPLQRLAQTMVRLGTPQTDVDSAFSSFHVSGQVKIP